MNSKDLIATLIIIAVGALWYAKSRGMEVPLLGSYRSAILVLLVLGMIMCATGSRVPAWPLAGGLPAFLGVLGGLALLVGIVGIAMGTKIWFDSLAGILVLMWAITTVRHMFA